MNRCHQSDGPSLPSNVSCRSSNLIARRQSEQGGSLHAGRAGHGRETLRVAGTTRYQELAPVDVELFVSSSVPRHAFSVLPKHAWLAPDVPLFRLTFATLVSLGWVVDDEQGTFEGPNQREIDLSVPHPYDLGPSWSGANSWRASFRAGATEIVGLVDHEWAHAHHGACDPGAELTSASPWRWHVLAGDRSSVCGRGETPVLAAFAAETALIEAGADIPERTKLRRALPEEV